MLLGDGLKMWAVKTESGDFVDYVAAPTGDEAANVVYQLTYLQQFKLYEVNPITGEEM